MLHCGTERRNSRWSSLACCDPVERGCDSQGGIDVAGKRKHRLVERCKQRPKDHHAGWRENVGQSAADAL